MKLPSLTDGFLGSLACVVAIIGTVAIWPFRFSSTSVCSQCGAEEFTTEWQLPHSDHTFFTRSSVKATPLSRYLSSSGLVRAHSHDWLFGHGGGNGVMCALGNGHRLWTMIGTPASSNVLESIRIYDGPDAARKFVKAALDPELSQREPLSMVVLFPTNGVSNKEQYNAWMSENRDLWTGTSN